MIDLFEEQYASTELKHEDIGGVVGVAPQLAPDVPYDRPHRRGPSDLPPHPLKHLSAGHHPTGPHR